MAKWGRRAEDQEWFIRLNRTEVWQHNIIWVTFLLLVLTGMMSLIPTTWVTGMFGNYTATVYRWRRFLHFFFAFWLFVGCVWHICYLAFSETGRQVFKDILLKPIDLIQMKENVLYMLGMRSHPPKFERYDYKEKLEYLFGAIGTTVIFITGTIMTLAPLFPKFIVEVAATFHLMEATLASFAISIWHFYAVHLKPGKFPQDTSWIDGKMTMHHLKEEHPAYYERVIKEREAQKRTTKEEPKFVLRDRVENMTSESDKPETGNNIDRKKERYREEDDL
jgi:cytochrome b subunit of formate dehydrogenase